MAKVRKPKVIQPQTKYDIFKRALANAYDSSKKMLTRTVLPNSAIAYPTLGNLAGELQERVKALPNGTYSPRNATLVSSAVNVPAYAGLAAIAALATGNDVGTAAGLAATYAGLEGCFRSYASAVSGKGTASLPGKFLGSIPELAVKIYDKFTEKASKRATLSPKAQREHDAILGELKALEENPQPRVHTREEVERMYAREEEDQNRKAVGLLKFAGEFGLAALAGMAHEVSGTHPDQFSNVVGALLPVAMIGGSTYISGNKLRTVPALAAGYLTGRFVVKAMKYAAPGAVPNLPDHIQV